MINSKSISDMNNSNVANTSCYSFYFTPISDKDGSIKFIDHANNNEQSIGLNVNDQAFGDRVEAQFPSIIADLIDLAVAIYASDRLIPITSNNFNNIPPRLFVKLPLRNSGLFNSDSFQEKLNNLLIWTTGNQWIFEFTKREVLGRLVEQKPIIFPTITTNSEVALWSGGLDSLAGLYTRIKTNSSESFILFGTGSNKIVASDQEKIAKQVKSSFSQHNIEFLRVPINFYQSNQQSKNKLSRARGILFTLLGSACAYLMGQRKLFVYENGVGAINLRYSKASIGLDHSRSVHPQTLSMVSDLVSEVIGEKFEVKNPFLFWTKVQMCKALAQDKRNDLVSSTASCDRPHRKKTTSQCGYCSSCLLRRLSLMAINLEDKTPYVITHGDNQLKHDPTLYFRSMQKQVQTLHKLLQQSQEKNMQWKYLVREFYELDDIVDRTYELENLSPSQMKNNLIKLYENYVSEWMAVESHLEKGFLNQSIAVIKS